jgi:hypothetical protein
MQNSSGVTEAEYRAGLAQATCTMPAEEHLNFGGCYSLLNALSKGKVCDCSGCEYSKEVQAVIDQPHVVFMKNELGDELEFGPFLDYHQAQSKGFAFSQQLNLPGFKLMKAQS